tara:strand:- start:2868 stop:3014 length:147 start_codon:yes stop_codon:yes gene_type:complete
MKLVIGFFVGAVIVTLYPDIGSDIMSMVSKVFVETGARDATVETLRKF